MLNTFADYFGSGNNLYAGIIKGEYNPGNIPQTDDEYAQDADATDVMRFKEFVITGNKLYNTVFTDRKGTSSLKSSKTHFYPNFYLPLSVIPQKEGLYAREGRLMWEKTEDNANDVMHRHLGSDSREDRTKWSSGYRMNFPDFEHNENRVQPNYTAFFVPYTEEEKENNCIPKLNTMYTRHSHLKGYNESKRFYSPDYSAMTPDEKMNDYRRTILWAPSAKPDGTGRITLTGTASQTSKRVEVSVEGCGENTCYSNCATFGTRIGAAEPRTTAPDMAIWQSITDNANTPPDRLADAVRANEQGATLLKDRNYDEAIEHFTQAAIAPYLPALTNLGICYNSGLGVEKSSKTAFNYFMSAAIKGDATAAHNVASYYFNGIVVEKNDSLALFWYEQAAEKGFAKSHAMLGIFHEEGIAVQPDRQTAMKHHKKAADAGVPEAMFAVGMYMAQADSANHLGKRELRESPAIKYIQDAANNGYSKAQAYLAECYRTGYYVKKDKKKMVKMLTEAAKQGDCDSTLKLGYCYERGIGVDENHKTAYQHYKTVMEQGNAIAERKVREFEKLGFFDYDSAKVF